MESSRSFDRYCSRKYKVEPVFVNPRLKLSTEFENVIKMEGDGLEKEKFPVLSTNGTGETYFVITQFKDYTFYWLHWPQACHPFSSATKSYIESLDVEQDIDLLKLYGWDLSIQCSRTLCISTMLLKEGAKHGLSPFQIESILCRETPNIESKIEEIVGEATDSLLSGTSEAAFLTSVSEIMCRYLDQVGN